MNENFVTLTQAKEMAADIIFPSQGTNNIRNSSAGNERSVEDIYEFTSNKNLTGTQSLFLHMNWGFPNGDYNAWFSFNNFNPNFLDFNDNKRMIYNIIP